ncbi:MAG: glycosyltransferase family 4 protein [Acidobacteriota bacterium]
MSRRLRIAHVTPVATAVPPPLSGSIETMASLLTEGLVARGHQVTLFAPGTSRTSAELRATFPRGYREEPSMWPWELCEMFNLSRAFESAGTFDLIHCQSEYAPYSLAFGPLVSTPVLHTVHHSPTPDEVAIWRTYPDAPFVALSEQQAQRLTGLDVAAVIPHGLDMSRFVFRAQPEDYLLFLGRFIESKGVVLAIEAARRTGHRLLLAAQENDYYRQVVAPLVDGDRVVYVGEVGHDEKVALVGGARALVYPVQSAEPFGLVLTEALACGTPVAAFDTGAVREVVDDGVTGGVFTSLEALVAGLPQVLALDRAVVRAVAVERFSADRMIDAYVAAYIALVDAHAARPRTA